MRKKWIMRVIGLLAMSLVMALSLSAPLQNFSTLPDHLRSFSGSELEYPGAQFAQYLKATIQSTNPNVVSLASDSKEVFAFQASEPGEANVTMKLFGWIPLRTVRVDVFPEIELVPGGQSIGVHLKSAGIMIVGYHQVQSAKDKTISPGEEAGIHIGDMVLKVDGNQVRSKEEFVKMVQGVENNRPLLLEVARGRETFRRQILPVKDEHTGQYQLGLYIRDSAAGVGTLTFYDPQHQVYGALGHMITDIDTQKPIVVGSGEILPSQVSSIDRGKSGQPGQKRAFFQDEKPIGSIEKNTPFGIFGQLERLPEKGMTSEPMPVALAEQVEEGPAEIYTVTEGNQVMKYDIEIVDVFPQRYPATKGMIIRVTDPQLLNKTGGIVQGMSGSPIIQNNRIVGAVTHVFVNDPTSGYATFIEWMLRDAGLLKGEPVRNLAGVA